MQQVTFISSRRLSYRNPRFLLKDNRSYLGNSTHAFRNNCDFCGSTGVCCNRPRVLKNLLLDEKDEAPGEDKFLGNAAEANKIIKLLIKPR